MILYVINQSNRYLAGTMEVPDDPEEIYGIPYGTTKKAPPPIPENHFAVWNGSGWDIVSGAPPAPVPPRYLLTVDAFYDRFGHAKYRILFSDNPEVQSYIQETRNSAYIDLDYPGLSEGVLRLKELGFEFDTDAVLSKVIQPGEAYIL